MVVALPFVKAHLLEAALAVVAVATPVVVAALAVPNGVPVAAVVHS